MLKWSKTYDHINPEEHQLVNGRILVKMPTIKSDDLGKFIITPDETIKQMQREMIKGELVKVSPSAFTDDGEEKPQIGDMVYFHSYAGNIYLTEDEYNYRNMSYKDLTGFEKQK